MIYRLRALPAALGAVLLLACFSAEALAQENFIKDAASGVAIPLKGLHDNSPILVKAILCKDGSDVSADLTRLLKNMDLPVTHHSERLATLQQSVASEQTSAGYGRMLLGTCIVSTDGPRLDLRLADSSTGQVLARYTSSVGAAPGQNSNEATALFTQLRRLADDVMSNLGRMDGNLRYQRFAVSAFEEIGTSTKTKQLGLVVAAQLQSMLQNDHKLFLVEREEVARLVDEIQLGQMGLVSEEDAVEIGKMSGAQALILGTVAEAGASFRVTVRIVSVGDAKVWATAHTTLPASDLIALSSEAAVLRSRTGAMYRAFLLPGWGQFYNREPVKGAMFMGGEALAAGLSAVFHLLGTTAQQDYESLGAGTQPHEFQSLRDDATRNYELRNIFLYTALGLHIAGFIDAAISGYDGEPTRAGNGSGVLSWAF